MDDGYSTIHRRLLFDVSRTMVIRRFMDDGYSTIYRRLLFDDSRTMVIRRLTDDGYSKTIHHNSIKTGRSDHFGNDVSLYRNRFERLSVRLPLPTGQFSSRFNSRPIMLSPYARLEIRSAATVSLETVIDS